MGNRERFRETTSRSPRCRRRPSRKGEEPRRISRKHGRRPSGDQAGEKCARSGVIVGDVPVKIVYGERTSRAVGLAGNDRQALPHPATTGAQSKSGRERQNLLLSGAVNPEDGVRRARRHSARRIDEEPVAGGLREKRNAVKPRRQDVLDQRRRGPRQSPGPGSRSGRPEASSPSYRADSPGPRNGHSRRLRRVRAAGRWRANGLRCSNFRHPENPCRLERPGEHSCRPAGSRKEMGLLALSESREFPGGPAPGRDAREPAVVRRREDDGAVGRSGRASRDGRGRPDGQRRASGKRDLHDLGWGEDEPIHSPSGEKNGLCPLSVPAIGAASGLSKVCR